MSWGITAADLGCCCLLQVTLECRNQHQELLVDVCKGFSERHHGCMWLRQAGVRLLCCAMLGWAVLCRAVVVAIAVAVLC